MLDDLLSELDEALILRILALLPPSALLALGACSRQLRALADRDELWAPLCAARWALPVAWAARARSWPAGEQGGPAYRKLPPPRVSGAHRGCELVRVCSLRTQPEMNGRLGLRLAFDAGRERWVVALLSRALPLPTGEPAAAAAAGPPACLQELLLLRPGALQPVLPAHWAAGGGYGSGGDDEHEAEAEVPDAGEGSGRAPPWRGAWKGAWAQRVVTDFCVAAELAHLHASEYAPGSAGLRLLVDHRRWSEGSATAVLAMRSLGEYGWEELCAHLPPSLQPRPPPGPPAGGAQARGCGRARCARRGGNRCADEGDDGSGYLRGARTAVEAVAAETALALAAPAPAPPCACAPARPARPCGAALLAFAFLRELSRDLRLRDWVRIECLLEGGGVSHARAPPAREARSAPSTEPHAGGGVSGGGYGGGYGGAGGGELPLECGALVVAAWDDPLCRPADIVAAISVLAKRVAERIAAGRAGGASAGGALLGNATPEAAAAAAAAEQADETAAEGGGGGGGGRAGGAAAAHASPASPLPRLQLEAVNEVLFAQLGLNRQERPYYDARNSLLQYVLLCVDWRHGLPISLAVLYQAVALRVGLRLQPISLPFHFVLGVPIGRAGAADSSGANSRAEQRLLVDVFSHGRLLSLSDARALVVSRAPFAWRDECAEPCSAKEVWLRMLRNLVGIERQQALSGRPIAEPYGALLAWAGASAEQRRMRIESDATLRALMGPDLKRHARRLALREGVREGGIAAGGGGGVSAYTSRAQPRPSWVEQVGGATNGDGGGAAWPNAISVTEVLGLWEPWC